MLHQAMPIDFAAFMLARGSTMAKSCTKRWTVMPPSSLMDSGRLVCAVSCFWKIGGRSVHMEMANCRIVLGDTYLGAIPDILNIII